MTAALAGWLIAGAGVGVAHALALWRTARGWSAGRWTMIWRLPVTAGMLALAAADAALLPTAAAWTGGFAAACAICVVRRP